MKTDEEDDKETVELAKELAVRGFCLTYLWLPHSYAMIQAKVPFTVMGSDKEFDVEGKKVRGRQYPWGTIYGRQVCGWHYLIFFFFLFVQFKSRERGAQRLCQTSPALDPVNRAK